ncbi:hypothetical protein M0R36_10575 [bacterium]|jgi:hypothetical protein|nr:hypothetical protein [bacterium]
MKIFVYDNGEVKMFDPNITPLCLLINESDRENFKNQHPDKPRMYIINSAYSEEEVEKILETMRPIVNAEYEKEKNK